MQLKSFFGKNVTIIDTEGQIFSGFVSDYIYPEDNEDNQESIIFEFSNGDLTEFKKDEIQEIIIN